MSKTPVLPDMQLYEAARADAQERADRIGHDFGLSWLGHWHVFSLPREENRCGYELRCEVVSPRSRP